MPAARSTLRATASSEASDTSRIAGRGGPHVGQRLPGELLDLADLGGRGAVSRPTNRRASPALTAIAVSE